MSLSSVKSFALGHVRHLQKKIIARKLPLAGYAPGLKSHLDELSDEILQDLNNLLDWNSFITDAKGRRFGMVACGVTSASNHRKFRTDGSC